MNSICALKCNVSKSLLNPKHSQYIYIHLPQMISQKNGKELIGSRKSRLLLVGWVKWSNSQKKNRQSSHPYCSLHDQFTLQVLNEVTHIDSALYLHFKYETQQIVERIRAEERIISSCTNFFLGATALFTKMSFFPPPKDYLKTGQQGQKK